MKIKEAIENLKKMNPDAELVVRIDTDEDPLLNRRCFISVYGFEESDVDEITYLDSLVSQEKTSRGVSVKF